MFVFNHNKCYSLICHRGQKQPCRAVVLSIYTLISPVQALNQPVYVIHLHAVTLITVSCPEMSSVTFLQSLSFFSVITLADNRPDVVQGLQFPVSQSDFIETLLHVQIAFRNLTVITQKGTAKFFTAISGYNYRSVLTPAHKEVFLTKGVFLRQHTHSHTP